MGWNRPRHCNRASMFCSSDYQQLFFLLPPSHYLVHNHNRPLPWSTITISIPIMRLSKCYSFRIWSLQTFFFPLQVLPWISHWLFITEAPFPWSVSPNHRVTIPLDCTPNPEGLHSPRSVPQNLRASVPPGLYLQTWGSLFPQECTPKPEGLHSLWTVPPNLRRYSPWSNTAISFLQSNTMCETTCAVFSRNQSFYCKNKTPNPSKWSSWLGK